MGYEQGQREGYEEGYQDCEERYKDPQENWQELEQSLRVSLKPKNESRPTTADAAAQTNSLPLPQQPPATVDTSPSLLMTENMPGTSMATSSSPTNPKLKKPCCI
jgi:hypothetical protein